MGDEGHGGVFASERFTHFHTQLMQRCAESDNVDLWFIAKDGTNVACAYNFRLGDTVYFYQSGLDGNAAPGISLGLLVNAQAMEDAIAKGYKRYDMMGGKTGSYKKDYNCDTAPMYAVTVYNRTFKGALVKTLRRMVASVRGARRSVSSGAAEHG